MAKRRRQKQSGNRMFAIIAIVLLAVLVLVGLTSTSEEGTIEITAEKITGAATAVSEDDGGAVIIEGAEDVENRIADLESNV